MPEQARQPDSNGAAPVADAQWTRLVAEWFEEQAALVVAELERAGAAADPPTAEIAALPHRPSRSRD